MELTKEQERTKKRWIQEIEDCIHYRKKSYKSRFEGIKNSVNGKKLLAEIKEYENKLLILKN